MSVPCPARCWRNKVSRTGTASFLVARIDKKGATTLAAEWNDLNFKEMSEDLRKHHLLLHPFHRSQVKILRL